jgi:hypothetical protein
MKIKAVSAILPLLALVAAAMASDILLKEDFQNLDHWRTLYFPKIARHSTYRIVTEVGAQHYLEASSNDSASAIVYQDTFNVYQYPRMKWQWKVANVYQTANPLTKAGDDYPLRIYVLFAYDRKNAGILDKIKYEAAKALYGEYPPQSSLNYVWSSKPLASTIVTSPYTDQAKMILLEQGAAKVGQWVTEEVDIVADYQRAFGHKPPAVASLAIMNDSDNTGEQSGSGLRGALPQMGQNGSSTDFGAVDGNPGVDAGLGFKLADGRLPASRIELCGGQIDCAQVMGHCFYQDRVLGEQASIRVNHRGPVRQAVGHDAVARFGDHALYGGYRFRIGNIHSVQAKAVGESIF